MRVQLTLQVASLIKLFTAVINSIIPKAKVSGTLAQV
jgi:hypothetical protein